MGPGLRPYVKRDYPMMLFKAYQRPEGGLDIAEDTPIVHDEAHRTRMEANGYRATPLEALAALEAQLTEFAKLAAEREWEKRHRLSPRAVAEVNAAEDEAGAEHLPTIAETPVRRRGRSKKAQSES